MCDVMKSYVRGWGSHFIFHLIAESDPERSSFDSDAFDSRFYFYFDCFFFAEKSRFVW